MKGIIIYEGLYGPVRHYADYLNKELQLPMLTPENLITLELQLCDFAIIGTSVFMNRLFLKKWLAQYARILQNKKVFLFIGCKAQPTEDERLNIVANNIPAFLKDSAVYFLPERIIQNRIPWTDKFVLKMGFKLKEDPFTNKEVQQIFKSVKKEKITDLVNAVKIFSRTKRKAIHSQIL